MDKQLLAELTKLGATKRLEQLEEERRDILDLFPKLDKQLQAAHARAAKREKPKAPVKRNRPDDSHAVSPLP